MRPSSILLPCGFVIALLLAELLLFTEYGYANDGSVSLLFYGMKVFFLGQVWVVLSEWMYLAAAAKWADPVLVLNRIFLINVLTTMLGFVLLLPVAMFMQPVNLVLESNSWLHALDRAIQESFHGFGYSEPLEQAEDFIGLLLFFLVTYLVSVYVEGYLLIRINRTHRLWEESRIMKHSFIFNGISYTGLLLIFLFLSTRPFPKGFAP